MFSSKQRKYNLLSDEELIAIYRSKPDTIVISILYKRYGHLVMGTAMNYLKNKQDAEDLTMQLFEGLSKKIATNSISMFKSWLYTVSKNECLMVLRKKGKTTLHLDTEIEHEEISLSEHIIKDQLLDQLNLSINELKEEQQQCIKLFYLEQKSYAEIVQATDMDIKKVKSAIQNGKRNLKILLEEHYETNGTK